MSMPILLIFLFLTFVSYRVFSKLCSDATSQGGTVGYAFFLFITGIIACVFFFCSNGFRITVTMPTLLFALCYAVIAIMCSVYTLKAFLYADVASVAVITSACGLIATAGIGIILFRETINIVKIIRIFVMLCAIVLVFLDVRQNSKSDFPVKQSKNIAFLFIIGVLILSNCASVITLKFYSLADNVADENSLFFFTNLFMILAVLPWLMIRLNRDRHQSIQFLQMFRTKSMFSIVAATISSNLNSLVSIRLISMMDVSVYTPVASAIEIVSGIAASLLFREKIGKYAMLAMVLTLIAVVI